MDTKNLELLERIKDQLYINAQEIVNTPDSDLDEVYQDTYDLLSMRASMLEKEHEDMFR